MYGQVERAQAFVLGCVLHYGCCGPVLIQQFGSLELLGNCMLNVSVHRLCSRPCQPLHLLRHILIEGYGMEPLSSGEEGKHRCQNVVL